MLTLDWGSVAALSDEDAAITLTGRVRQIDAILRTSFLELGLICQIVEGRKLWSLVQTLDRQPVRSFNHWLEECAPYSRSHCYAAKKIAGELSRDIPPETMIGIDETNARLLASISSDVRRDPEVIEAAKNLSGNEFAAKMAEEQPNQHIENRRMIRFNPVASAAEQIEMALKMAQLHGAETREAALEMICAMAVQEWQMEDSMAEAVYDRRS